MMKDLKTSQSRWPRYIKVNNLQLEIPFYKRPKNIKEHIIRAKVPALLPPRPKRIIPGMSKCKGCPICPYIKPGKRVRATATTFTADIEQQVNCQTRNIVYCIQCKKCCIQYIGESQRTLQDRISDHRGYITKSQTNKATGEHFNLPGHKVSDMEVTILEKIFNEDLNTESKESRCGLRNLIPSIRG